MLSIGKRICLFLATLLIFVVVGAGCARAKITPSHRKGVFAQLSEGQVDRNESKQGSLRASPIKMRRIIQDWGWPLKEVVITSPFGSRNGSFHEGLDLKAKSGTPVFSVAEGVVAYAGDKLSGYGKLVIVKHDSGLSSIYAHNSTIRVKKGQRIKKGAWLANSGRSGHVSGPHVHFEIRSGITAIDPVEVLTMRGAKYDSSVAVASR